MGLFFSQILVLWSYCNLLGKEFFFLSDLICHYRYVQRLQILHASFFRASSITGKINIFFTYQSIKTWFTVQICNMFPDCFACRGKSDHKQSEHGSIHRGIHSWIQLLGALEGDIWPGCRSILAFPNCQQPVAFAGVQQKCKSPFMP